MPARIIVCINQRIGVGPSCGQPGEELLAALRQAVAARGLSCSVETVSCFGFCSQAPNVRIAGGRFFHRADVSQIDEILAEASAEAVSEARSAPGS